MNLLLSAYACMPNSGSEPGNGWNWATHLVDRGLNVTVLTREDNRPAIENYVTLCPILNLRFEYVPIPVKRLRNSSGLNYVLWQIFAVTAAKALHRDLHFDIVHHVTYTSIHVPTQLWKLRLPTVFGPVGGGQTAPVAMLPYFGESRKSEERRTLLTRALRYSPFHRRWLRKMSVVLAANRDTLNLISALGRPDVRLQFDNGITTSYLSDEPRSFNSEDSSPLRLLWVGRLLPRKAIPLALDALSKTKSSATLTIVGDGLCKSTLRAMIAERGLNGRVFWAGRRLTFKEVHATYLEHDAFLFTSLRETSGVQLLEAMATALPVITLDLHGAHDLVPAAASLMVPVKTIPSVIADLAAAIDTFAARSPEAKRAMSQASLDYARQNTWSLRAENAEMLYREILAKNRPDKLVIT